MPESETRDHTDIPWRPSRIRGLNIYATREDLTSPPREDPAATDKSLGLPDPGVKGLDMIH
ncbi:hypothetical protein GCM10018966_039680 [Streptomyces yanii]